MQGLDVKSVEGGRTSYAGSKKDMGGYPGVAATILRACNRQHVT